jgi:hypothetical protein
MEYATLGNTGLMVSKLCFGTMTFGDRGGLFSGISAVGQAEADQLVRTSIDVWTHPVSEWRAVEERREVRVDGISPVDTVVLRNGAQATRLKGAEFEHFAGFLSRSRREHDYLWGRLDAAERLIDIVSDAAAMEGALGKTDIRC